MDRTCKTAQAATLERLTNESGYMTPNEAMRNKLKSLYNPIRNGMDPSKAKVFVVNSVTVLIGPIMQTNSYSVFSNQSGSVFFDMRVKDKLVMYYHLMAGHAKMRIGESGNYFANEQNLGLNLELLTRFTTMTLHYINRPTPLKPKDITLDMSGRKIRTLSMKKFKKIISKY
jgi:hypothetical protein